MSRRGRTVLGRLAMLAGAALTIGGLALRFGVGMAPGVDPAATPVAIAVATADPTTGASSSPAPASTQLTAPSATPQPAFTPDATPAPSAPPSPSAPPGSTWFADEFDAVAAWPTGDLNWPAATVTGGSYRIEAQATDLPVVVLAAAGEGSPGADVMVTTRLAIGPGADPATAAGIALEAADGARLLVLLGADGRVAVYRDTIESLDGLASGSIAAPPGMVELQLTIADGVVAVVVDGRLVVSAQAAIEPVAVGLAFWALGGPAIVAVDRYEVLSLHLGD